MTISVQSKDAVSIEDIVLYTESINDLYTYDEPDPGAYEHRPDAFTLARAELGRRSAKFESILESIPNTGGSNSNSPEKCSATEDDEDNMRAGCLTLLMLLAQAYHHLLDRSVALASWASMLDMELNASYFWVTSNLSNLLSNSPSLSDFPLKFKPALEDLYPSTIGDLEWEMIAPTADSFLSSVQRYAQTNSTFLPLVEGSNGWNFVELFRSNINLAIKRGDAYYERIKASIKKMNIGRGNMASPQTATAAGGTTASPTAAQLKGTNYPQIFISYSHDDEKFLKQLRQHLKPIERAACISAWCDTQIKPGSKWFEEINSALKNCSVAVLLVSPAFLASDFIHNHELGPLLRDAKNGGVTLLWILIRDCSWQKSPIADLQAALPPSKAIANMKAERDAAWVSVCNQIEAAISRK